MIVWRRRRNINEEQVANAKDSFVNLAPVSQTPAETVRVAWGALLPGQLIPLIGERRYGREE